MKTVFHRWQLWLLALFAVSLPSQVTAYSVDNFHESEFTGKLFAAQNFELGIPGRTLKSVDISTGLMPLDKNEARSKARSILERTEVPRPAQPKASTFARTTKPASVAKLIEFNRFSVKEFAESGFAPNCMFVDQSTAGFFLENMITGIPKPSNAAIYSVEAIEVANEPKRSDPYWQYFSDCDKWNVVFARPSSAAKQPRPNSQQAMLTIGVTRGLTSAISQALLKSGAEIYQIARQVEFFVIEAPKKSTAPPAKKTLIDQLKSVRPIFSGVINHDLVRTTFGWNRFQQLSIQMQTHQAKCISVWNSLWETSLFDGPIESNAAAPTRDLNTNSRR